MAWYIDAWQKKFPNTMNFLVGEFPEFIRRPAIFGAFVDVASMSADEAVRVATFGTQSESPPLIWFKDIGGKAGLFEQDHANRILLSDSVATRFEASPNDTDAQTYLGAKVLHEMVHWSLFRQHRSEATEMGVEFETRAFGGQVPPFWLDAASTGMFLDEVNGPGPTIDHAIAAKLQPGDFANKDLGSGLPRGIRNNNPGNIRRSSAAWLGLARPDELKPFQVGESAFCVFSSAEFGLRAMGVILRNYQEKIGLRTVEGMINRWAPPSDNNFTDNYITSVCAVMQISPHDVFSFRSQDLGVKMLKAMIKVENGMQPYSDAQLIRGHAMATS